MRLLRTLAINFAAIVVVLLWVGLMYYRSHGSLAPESVAKWPGWFLR